jgi:hypothetical protein
MKYFPDRPLLRQSYNSKWTAEKIHELEQLLQDDTISIEQIIDYFGTTGYALRNAIVYYLPRFRHKIPTALAIKLPPPELKHPRQKQSSGSEIRSMLFDFIQGVPMKLIASNHNITVVKSLHGHDRIR